MSRIIAPPPSGPVEPRATQPTLSIVIRAYQAAATIGAAVRSALAQTRPAHEIIVVDDGSTDDLDAALADYRDRVVLVRKPHGGLASASNAALASATGEFMAILDADDAYHPNRVAALADLATARPDLDLITTDARFIVDGVATGTFREHNPFAVENQRTAIFKRCFVGGWPAVRVERALACGGFDESLRGGVDWDCWLRLLLRGSKAGLVDEPYYDYVLRPGSLTASRVASLWDRVRLLEKATGDPRLLPSERGALTHWLRHHRSRAVLAEAQASLGSGAPRGRLVRLATVRGIEPGARARVGLTVAAPRLARRLLPRDRSPLERFAATP